MLMNTILKQSVRLGQRRFQSSSTATSIYVAKKEALGFKKTWLQDASTYPLIGIMSFAGALVVGVMASCLMYNPDVQISPNKRGAVIRHWNF